jgi:hypothetical protein
LFLIRRRRQASKVPGDLAAQDRYFVPQHQDLRSFGCIAAREQRQPAERPDHEQAGEAEERKCPG